MNSDNHTKFLELRENYPVFTYENHSFRQKNDKLELAFEFVVGDGFIFRPKWRINIPVPLMYDSESVDLDAMVFHIGLIEMLSYWKAFCSPVIRIKKYKLNDNQQFWWKKLYRYGLGEFFYTNGIPLPGDDLFHFQFDDSALELPSKTSNRADCKSVIVPVGGGKDSIVGLELLKSTGKTIVPFVVNPRKATDNVLETAGFTPQESIIVHRSIDPLLLELNCQGFLNGHTPFSALLAFAAVFAAQKTGIREIALSNESSANEATIPGTKINHQYSKSFEFETDYRHYIANYVDDDISYFSLLRPLNELQIAERFAHKKQFHNAFKSCNVGSKQDIWCCKCSKCLFTFIILSPFLSSESLQTIFGCNLFEDEELVTELEALFGLASEKPFECVGTLDDVNIALVAVIKKHEQANESLPVLLAHYRKSSMFEAYKDRSMEEYLGTFNEEHFVPERYLSVVERG